ncbi:hypothetical protein QOT17_003669 [Balamuthia mandrillaris]
MESGALTSLHATGDAAVIKNYEFRTTMEDVNGCNSDSDHPTEIEFQRSHGLKAFRLSFRCDIFTGLRGHREEKILLAKPIYMLLSSTLPAAPEALRPLPRAVRKCNPDPMAGTLPTKELS